MDDNYGIFNITNIEDPYGNFLWQSGDEGEYLTGVFYGIDITTVTNLGGNNYNLLAVNGQMDIYLNNSNCDPTKGTDGYYIDNDYSQYEGITDIGGSLFLSLDMVPGIDPNSASTMNGNLNQGTNPITGDVSYYLQMTGGSHMGLFQQNLFEDLPYNDGANLQDADFFAQTDFTDQGACADWDFKSDDPVIGATVPIPGAVYLLGTGLLGLAGLRRKFIG